MDVHNNKIGQQIGAKYPYASEKMTAKYVLEALINGELNVIKVNPKNRNKAEKIRDEFKKGEY